MIIVVSLVFLGSTVLAFPRPDADPASPAGNAFDTDTACDIDSEIDLEKPTDGDGGPIINISPGFPDEIYHVQHHHHDLETTKPLPTATITPRMAVPDKVQVARWDTSRFPEQTNIPEKPTPSTDTMEDLPTLVRCHPGKALCDKRYVPTIVAAKCFCVLDEGD